MNASPEELAKFEKARRRCVDQYRALASLESSHDYALRLFSEWGRHDPIILSALHSATVMAYSRPFSQSKTSQGSREFPVKDLKRVAPNFDDEMHRHILRLRNQIIAHSDYSWLRSTMFYQAIGDGGSLPVELGINVKRIRGIEDRALSERYLEHVASCVMRLSTIFDEEFNNLARQVRDDPSLFGLTANIPTEISRDGPNPNLTALPPPKGAASNVEEPDFSDKIGGYRFEMLTHKRALVRSGTYLVLVNGTPQEFTFVIEGPEI